MSKKPLVVYGPTKNGDLFACVQCPACGRKGWIDRERYEGKVSIVCECGWHETHDLRPPELTGVREAKG